MFIFNLLQKCYFKKFPEVEINAKFEEKFEDDLNNFIPPKILKQALTSSKKFFLKKNVQLGNKFRYRVFQKNIPKNVLKNFLQNVLMSNRFKRSCSYCSVVYQTVFYFVQLRHHYSLK